jgi:hypothetical protein
MLQLITGRWIAQALYAAATLGVADHLKDGPQPADALARAVGAHPGALHRLLRALASLGVFQQDAQNRFALTPLGETLRSDVPHSLRGFARMTGMPATWQAWGEVLHSVKTGQSAFEHVHGQNGFEYFAGHPDAAAIFDAAMTNFSAMVLPVVLASYDFAPFRLVVDVAGGRGHLLAAILAAHPSAQGILFDLPHVAEGARQLLAGAGLSERSQVVTGDFFQGLPAGGDVYLLKHIIHDWDDERAQRILESCRGAMGPTGRVLVLEMVIPPGDEPFFGKLLDLEMLVITPGGRERLAAEYQALLERAGLRLNRIIPTESPISIIEGVPAV